jgi:hypothetical protein
LLLGKLPKEIAEGLSLRELLVLAEKRQGENAAKILTMMNIVYHSAIAPHSKKAQNWIQRMGESMRKAL